MKGFNYSAPVIIILSLLAVSAPSAEWRDDLAALLAAGGEAEQDELINSIVAANPDYRDVIDTIRTIEFPDVESRGELLLRDTLCLDGKTRPWVLYIPEGYDPAQPTPLIVVPHGGVGSALLPKNPLGYATWGGFPTLGREYGMIMVFPMGQYGVTWWDKVGMGNIENLVRTARREFNVDDDRVYMGGFSDGASASFLFAMARPNDYAAFVALNGHMGVGSMDGDASIYPVNLSNTSVYATTTDNDHLYPTRKMAPTIELAREAGADIVYRQLEGVHDFDFHPTEMPLIAEFLEEQRRDPAPAEFVWEAAITKYCRYHWFVIDGIDSSETAEWHKEYNVKLLGERVILGFTWDEYEGEGVEVHYVFDYTPAADMGLEKGDIVIKGDDYGIVTPDDFAAWMGTLQRGDEFEMTVLRDSADMELAGRLPDPAEYDLFVYDKPSARVNASFADNRVDVESSRLTAFKVLINPELIDLEQNLVIDLDGTVVFDEPVSPDIEYLLRDFLKNRDRKEIYVNEVRVEL